MSIVSLYKELVVRGGLSPDYFFNMDFFEAQIYLEGLRDREKSELERVRLIMWASLVPHSKKSLELEDVLRIEGNKQDQEESENNKKEMDALRERAKKMEELLNEQHLHQATT